MGPATGVSCLSEMQVKAGVGGLILADGIVCGSSMPSISKSKRSRYCSSLISRRGGGYHDTFFSNFQFEPPLIDNPSVNHDRQAAGPIAQVKSQKKMLLRTGARLLKGPAGKAAAAGAGQRLLGGAYVYTNMYAYACVHRCTFIIGLDAAAHACGVVSRPDHICEGMDQCQSTPHQHK